MSDDLQAWTEVKFDYKNHLLSKLNRSEDITHADIDLTKVKGGFLSSRLYFLHDGPRKKTLSTALHIPNRSTGEIHHYVVDFFCFKRKKNTSPWTLEPVDRLDESELEKLKEFFNEQDELVGKTPKKTHYKIFTSDSSDALINLDLALNFISEKRGFDFSQIDQTSFDKILNLVKNILQGASVILPTDIYAHLSASRTNSQSIYIYRKNLATFKQMVDDPSTTETMMQNFLTDKVWFFGLNYVQSHRNSKPKFNASLGSEYDFLLEGFNQVYDVVELKGPNEGMFEIESSAERKASLDSRVDYKFSGKFSRALHQVMSYMDEFETSFDHIQQGQPSIKNFMYPKGTIVISKRVLFPEKGKNSSKYLHLINRQFANIDILTYDDLADRAQIIIDFVNHCKKD